MAKMFRQSRLLTHINTYIHTLHVCMYVCMYVCVYVCMHVLCMCLCIRIPACLSECTYIRVRVCVFISILIFVTFSAMLRLSRYFPVVTGVGNRSTRLKPPPNPKSLATF